MKKIRWHKGWNLVEDDSFNITWRNLEVEQGSYGGSSAFSVIWVYKGLSGNWAVFGLRTPDTVPVKIANVKTKEDGRKFAVAYMKSHPRG